MIYITEFVFGALYWYFTPLNTPVWLHAVGVLLIVFGPPLLFDICWCHFLDKRNEDHPNIWVVCGLSFIAANLGAIVQVHENQLFMPDVVIPNVAIVIFALYFLFKYR